MLNLINQIVARAKQTANVLFFLKELKNAH